MSGEAARGILQKEFGVKADIKIKAHGYDQDFPEGDDSFDRQVQVDIQSGKGEKRTEKQTLKEGKPGQEQGLKGEDEITEPITDAIRRGLEGLQNILFPGVERPDDKAEQLPENRRSYKQEMAERKKVEAQDGAIARAFGKPPTEQNIREWYNKLPTEDKNLLRNPDSKITLFASTSRPGSFEANKELAEKSLEVTKRILEQEYGVKAKISTRWGIPAGDAAPGRDDRFLRHVQVIIEKPKT